LKICSRLENFEGANTDSTVLYAIKGGRGELETWLKHRNFEELHLPHRGTKDSLIIYKTVYTNRLHLSWI
jgi:hypothetical protein